MPTGRTTSRKNATDRPTQSRASAFWPANYHPGPNIVLLGVNVLTNEIAVTAGPNGNIPGAMQAVCQQWSQASQPTQTATATPMTKQARRSGLTAAGRARISEAQRKRHAVQAKVAAAGGH